MNKTFKKEGIFVNYLILLPTKKALFSMIEFYIKKNKTLKNQKKPTLPHVPILAVFRHCYDVNTRLHAGRT